MSNGKTYDKEFKLNAIKLFENNGKKIGEIENDLGIGRGNLRRWIKHRESNNDLCFLGNSTVIGENLEISELKKENKILREERDILKKVVSIFS